MVETLTGRGDVEVAPFLNGAEGRIENNVLCINFSSNFNKNLIQKDRKKVGILKSAVDELYGGDFEINLYCDNISPAGNDDFEDNARKKAEELGVTLEIE